MKKLSAIFVRKTSLFIFLFIFLYQTIFLININAQTVSVKGQLTASRLPVRYASVTFIDNADTASRFTALTDASGDYEINLSITSVKSGINLPSKFELEQNYPNPFYTTTNIPYGLKKVSDVQVTIYDILGRVVRRFNAGWQSKGAHNILWDGLNNSGQRVAAGVYFYRLSAGGESRVKKMIFDQNVRGLAASPNSYSVIGSPSGATANKVQHILGNNFTVRIQNTSTTTPLIVQNELKNVTIQNDTTINFLLTYIPSVTVDPDSLHQIISGFGAASPWYLPAMTDSEVATAFGTGNGELGFTILRLTIEPDKSSWSQFVPSAKKAYDMGAKIIASSWYAPPGMTETVNGESILRPDMYGAYAAHLDSFYTYMKNNGVPVYGISVQNEPDIGNWTNWTPGEILTFMKDYADSIKGPKIMAPESYHFDRSYSDPILNDSIACAHTDIICGHIYGVNPTLYPLAEQKGKEIWMTEYLSGDNDSGNNLSWAISAGSSFSDAMQADMSAYVWWTIVRYYGPIADGQKSTQNPNEDYSPAGAVTKKGYVMSQFAKFIRPGYYRVQSSLYPTLSNIKATAYKDSTSGKIVIVAINPGSARAEVVFKIQNGAAAAFTPYTTSGTKNCEQGNQISFTGGSFTFTMEPSSITTFVSN